MFAKVVFHVYHTIYVYDRLLDLDLLRAMLLVTKMNEALCAYKMINLRCQIGRSKIYILCVMD